MLWVMWETSSTSAYQEKVIRDIFMIQGQRLMMDILYLYIPLLTFLVKLLKMLIYMVMLVKMLIYMVLFVKMLIYIGMVLKMLLLLVLLLLQMGIKYEFMMNR